MLQFDTTLSASYLREGMLEYLEYTIHHTIKLNAERCTMMDASRRHGYLEIGGPIELK